MSRSFISVAGVIALSGLLTAVGAIAVVGGWNTGPWTEALLLIGTLIVIAAAGWIVIELAIAASLRVAAFLFAPEEPRGLIRIRTIMDQHQAEQQAAATDSHRHKPPPG